ncbi:hypothetical protein MW887_006540 [Aspergillus wentii]|nr:hypothetical protein MW887_006540 [Aspergillus wentii]
MSREIDQLPVPAAIRQMKVIVASPSRSGTLGLYRAMQILGYNSYHLYECVAVHGVQHMKIFKEAITAQYYPSSGVKRITRADCDKWLADYDCLVEIPSYLGVDVIKAYANDPDVKFILTERSPEKWAKSVRNSVGKVVAMSGAFPFNILKYFDAFLWHFFDFNVLVYRAIGGENEELLYQYYTEYLEKVKTTLPADRLCLIRLEDGIDWETICPFLGVPVPQVAYPGRNEPEKFQAMVQEALQPKVTAAMMRMGAVVVPVLGILGWASKSYFWK